MTPIRVVFDSNIFSLESFDALETSPLRRLFAARRVSPIYGHVFIEETLRAYGSSGKRDQLVTRWLPFIVATCDCICNDFNEIFHEELVRGRGPNARKFMKRLDYERLKKRFPHVPLDGTWLAWRTSKAERDLDNQKRAAQREISKEIRAEVVDWKKAIRYRAEKHGIPNFGKYIQTEIDSAGREFISAIIKTRNPREVGNRWSRDKNFYPYFTEFVYDMLYMSYYAMTKPDAALVTCPL